MIKKTLIILLLIQITGSSEFSIETLYRQCFDFSQSCAIPVVRYSDTSNHYKQNIVNNINSVIQERFMMSPYDTLEECRWTYLEYESKIKEDYLWISWTGTYYGAYDNSISEVFIFRLSNGDYLSELAFPIELFFKPKSFSSIFPSWNDSCPLEINNAIKCTDGYEPYCLCSEPFVELTDTSIIAQLSYDCLPRVIQACTPYFSIERSLSLLHSFLSPLGKEILLNSDYLTQEPFEQFIIYQNYIENLEDPDIINKNVQIFYDINKEEDLEN